MAVVRNLMVRAVADFSSLISQSAKAGTAAQRWSRDTSTAYKKATEASAQLETSKARLLAHNDGWSRALGMVRRFASVAALTQFAKSAIDAASELNEVQNVVDKAFGGMANQAEDFSRRAVTQFGLAEAQAKKYAATYMAMGTSMGLQQQQAADMAIGTAGMAGDVASFFNISQEEAYSKLRGIYTGETEALKDLGAVMTQDNLKAYALAQGITTSYTEMSQAQKVALRYRFVMDALSVAQGDYAGTAHQWANNVRTLKNQFVSLLAVLGTGFIAVLNPVVTVLNTLLGRLVEFANGVSKVFSTLFGSAQTNLTATPATASVSGLEDALSGVEDAADAASDSVGGVGKAAKSAASAAKELTRAVMGFDKINRLPSVSSGSSGGGSSGGGSSGGGGGSAGGVAGGLAGAAGSSVLDDVTDKVEQFSGALGALKDWLDKLNFAPLEAAWGRLKESGGKLAGIVKDGLGWGLEHVLAPLAKWSIEEAAPRGVELLANGMELLSDTLIVLEPGAKWIWEQFLAPLAAAAGNAFCASLDALNGTLKTLDEGLKDIQKLMDGEITFGELLKKWLTVENPEETAEGYAALLRNLSPLLTLAEGDGDTMANKLARIAAAPLVAVGETAGKVAADVWTTFDKIGGGLAGVFESVKGGFASVFSAESLAQAAQSAGALWDGLKEGAGQAVAGIGQFFESLGSAPTTALENLKGVFDSTFSAESLTRAKESAAALWKSVKEGAEGAAGPVVSVFSNFGGNAKELWNSIKESWANNPALELAVNVKNNAAEWWSNVKSWWAGKVGNVKEFETSAKNSAGTWWSNVKSWWAGKVGNVKEFATSVKNSSGTWWANVKSWWKDKASAALSVAVKITDSSRTWWSNVKKWWADKAKALTAKIKLALPKITLTTKSVTLLKTKITYPTGFSVKWNAKGGILNGATLFGAAGNTLLGGGEAGKEAVLPLERNTEWMDRLADRLAQRIGGAGNQPIQVQVVLDGRVVAESTIRELERMARRGQYPLAGKV